MSNPAAQQGQTDQVLKVKLESQLILARWLDVGVAANGEAGLEVGTQFVGHGAPIKITVKDAEGKAVGSLEGKVLQGWFRARFRPDAKAAGKTLFFEAELPKHSLKLASGPSRWAPSSKSASPSGWTRARRSRRWKRASSSISKPPSKASPTERRLSSACTSKKPITAAPA